MTPGRRTPLRAEHVERHSCTISLRLEVLRRTPFFAGLPEGDIPRLGGLFRQEAFSPGQTIYVAGDPAVNLYVVASGKVKLIRTAPVGKTIVLGIVGAGESFGSLSELGDKAYPDMAIAHTGCCVLAIAAGDFRKILRQYPPVAAAALDIVASRLRAMHDLVERLSAYSVEQRIASTLLTLAARFGEKRGNALLIQAPLSRQDLADMTGTTRESASRVMAQFRQAGLVRSGRQWVAILDPARLASETAAGRNP